MATSSTITIGHPNPQWAGSSVIYGNYETLKPMYINCANCRVEFNTGLAGLPAESQDEAIVAAHANGWYVIKLRICPECRKQIAPEKEDGLE